MAYVVGTCTAAFCRGEDHPRGVPVDSFVPQPPAPVPFSRQRPFRRLPTLWTNSYFVATVGGTTLEVVNHHVENQRNA